MEKQYNLTRFLHAQNQVYLRALEEVSNGRKQSHWMWYIFPQLAGLGHSDTAKYYAIQNIDEATAYLRHPVLGKHLVEIAATLLGVEVKTVHEIFGSPDDLKLCSSMTLFAQVADANPVFGAVINKYFGGLYDNATLHLLQKNTAQ
jgi:uncharacterized protein (DUF1810 family)